MTPVGRAFVCGGFAMMLSGTLMMIASPAGISLVVVGLMWIVLGCTVFNR